MLGLFRFLSCEASATVDCIHPHCPNGRGAASWASVAADPTVKLQPREKTAFTAHMDAHFGIGPVGAGSAHPTPPVSKAALGRLLRAAPCLFNQLDMPATPRAVVHFCELTLGAPITAANVHDAFLVQHPSQGRSFSPGPHKVCKDGGTVMEMLCSEVLANAGIPPMAHDDDGWPRWTMPGHVLLNEGKMSRWKALGDILVPCAPTNLVISVKTEAARERLLYSANSIEGVGFGFFSQPNEFWTVSRMTLLKRMGFTAIYMPDSTHASVMTHLDTHGTRHHATNINGRDLYRPFTSFADDMKRAVGRSSDEL